MDVELKTALAGIRETVSGYGTNMANMQRQLDALDTKSQGRLTAGETTDEFLKILEDSPDLQKLFRDKKGSAIINLAGKAAFDFLQRKTTITSAPGSTGVATTGVLTIDRIQGITPEARQGLTVRDVLVSRPTEMQLVDFVRVLTPNSIASPQVEASVKAENQLVFQSQSEKVRTIATWQPASRQVLDDFGELLNFLENSLRYYVNLAEEQQLLSGDGTGENLHGLIPQSTAFNTALLGNAWNKIDVIGRAVQQITTAKEIPPTFAILNTNDWWGIRLTKDGFGRYILGDPQSSVGTSLFDLTVVPTTSIANGTFLVGSGNPAAAEIRDRMEMQFEISTSHADYFTKNLVACRAEKRLALIVKRPGSFISGSFTTSP